MFRYQILIIFFIILGLLSACQRSNENAKGINNLEVEGARYVNLEGDFQLAFSEEEDYENFVTYANLCIVHNNRIVYLDSLSEYEIKIDFPHLRRLEDGFEIWLYMNDRPSRDKIVALRVVDHDVIYRKELPLFSSTATDVDGDGYLESIGFLEHQEVYGESESKTSYNPILVYEHRQQDLILDSVHTIFMNRELYGDFYGFSYNEEVVIPVNSALEKAWTLHL